jgi:hypothetical protein
LPALQNATEHRLISRKENSKVVSTSFDAGPHVYRDGNQELISVTRVLSAVGVVKDLDFLNLDPIYRDRGDAVHQILGLIDRENDYDEEGTHESLRSYAAQIIRWKADTGFQGRVWELPMVNRRMKIAGTLDVGGDARDEIWIVDGKTGSLQECGVACQVAAYEDLLLRGEVIDMVRSGDGEWEKVDYDREWIAYVRQHPEKIRRKSLNLKANSPYTMRSHDEVSWPGRWRAAVTVYHMLNEYNLLRKREGRAA